MGGGTWDFIAFALSNSLVIESIPVCSSSRDGVIASDVLRCNVVGVITCVYMSPGCVFFTFFHILMRM